MDLRWVTTNGGPCRRHRRQARDDWRLLKNVANDAVTVVALCVCTVAVMAVLLIELKAHVLGRLLN